MWFKMHNFSKSALFPNKNPEIVKFGQICKFNSVQGIAGINFPSISGSCGRIVKREKIPEKLWKIAKKKNCRGKNAKIAEKCTNYCGCQFSLPWSEVYTQTHSNPNQQKEKISVLFNQKNHDATECPFKPEWTHPKKTTEKHKSFSSQKINLCVLKEDIWQSEAQVNWALTPFMGHC